MSPIDFIIEFGHGVYRGAAREAGCVQVKPENEDLFDCAFWLCRQLGISPADLGWRDHEGPPPYDEVPEYCLGEPGTQGFGRPPEPPPPASAPEGPGRDLAVILVTGGHRHQAADGGLDALKRARVPLYVRDLEIVSVVPKLKTISKGTRISMPVIHRVGLPGLGRFAGQGARWHATTNTADCSALIRRGQ